MRLNIARPESIKVVYRLAYNSDRVEKQSSQTPIRQYADTLPLGILGAIVFILLASASTASTYTVSGNTYVTTGAESDVQSAVNRAPNGSTVTIPDGSYIWPFELNIRKYVILQAANMPTWPTPSKVNITHGGGSTYLISITASSAGNTVLAGVNFLPGAATNVQSYLGTNGTARPILMHDCTFNVPDFKLLHAVEWLCGNGVVWHCHFFGSTASARGSGSGGFYNEGNLGWWQVDTFGNLDTTGTTNLYIEDCLFDNLTRLRTLEITLAQSSGTAHLTTPKG